MESLEHAMKRDAPIIAEYLGGAVNCDAYHLTDPRADGMGVSSCITKSLEDAGVAPEEVSLKSIVNEISTSSWVSVGNILFVMCKFIVGIGHVWKHNTVTLDYWSISLLPINSVVYCLPAVLGSDRISFLMQISMHDLFFR
jgi:hypothetical protein